MAPLKPLHVLTAVDCDLHRSAVCFICLTDVNVRQNISEKRASVYASNPLIKGDNKAGVALYIFLTVNKSNEKTKQTITQYKHYSNSNKYCVFSGTSFSGRVILSCSRDYSETRYMLDSN